MSVRPSIIPAGNLALRGYEENGVYRQAEGIQSYVRFYHFAPLGANTWIAFRCPSDIELSSIWIVTSDTAFSDSAVGRIEVTNDLLGSGYIYQLDFPLAPIRVAPDGVGWEPPLVILEENQIIKMRVSQPVYRIAMYGKMVHLEPPILGNPVA